jgi:hypothetical protein
MINNVHFILQTNNFATIFKVYPSYHLAVGLALLRRLPICWLQAGSMERCYSQCWYIPNSLRKAGTLANHLLCLATVLVVRKSRRNALLLPHQYLVHRGALCSGAVTKIPRAGDYWLPFAIVWLLRSLLFIIIELVTSHN